MLLLVEFINCLHKMQRDSPFSEQTKVASHSPAVGGQASGFYTGENPIRKGQQVPVWNFEKNPRGTKILCYGHDLKFFTLRGTSSIKHFLSCHFFSTSTPKKVLHKLRTTVEDEQPIKAPKVLVKMTKPNLKGKLVNWFSLHPTLIPM